MAAPIVLDSSFGITVLSAELVVLHYTLHGMPVGKMRLKLFKNRFFRESVEFKRLEEAHKKVFETDIDGLGFPDTGSGRLSALLSDEDWFRFNSVERCHLNYLETLPLYLSSILLGGLYFPIPVAVCAGCIIVGRTMFSCGYVRKGAPGRTIGFVLATLAAFTAFGFTVYGAIGQLGSG